MESAEIARRFLAYFEQQGHTIVPSASLVADDPTVLFVIAGMQPFKPYLLGQRTPPYKRAADVQKCVRTLDIEEVGKTTRHATFFQMLGNFSFGDYFKDQAIPYAWELLTGPESGGGFGFPADRLWATVYHDDDEAAKIWRDIVGLPESRIQRRGMADNFWSMGVPGPCGPCSEIYYDRGPEYGREGGPVVDEDRYLEVWNLVFMQYFQDTDGTRTPLKQPNIDTGMGLERLATVLQGVESVYDTDLFRPIIDEFAALVGTEYGKNAEHDQSLRVISDHGRALVFLAADGVLPSNEGRGYVLRRSYNLRASLTTARTYPAPNGTNVLTTVVTYEQQIVLWTECEPAERGVHGKKILCEAPADVWSAGACCQTVRLSGRATAHPHSE
jgi:alanyl-tRNA synthetase